MNKIILIASVLILNISSAQNLRKVAYLFDAGGNESIVQEEYELVTTNKLYDQNKGFGWTIAPDSAYFNSNLQYSTVRNNLTVDGVEGKELAFKINLPHGKWNFIFWMEQGLEDVNTASLYLNDEYKKINWHQHHGEGDSAFRLRKYYRIYQTNVSIDDGFEFKLKGGNDIIRLLGFALIPMDFDEITDTLQLSKIIYEAGRYKSKVNLSDLLAAINEKLKTDEDNTYLRYWKLQTELLSEADRLINMMGWEWARRITNMSIFDRLHQALNLLDSQLEHFDNTNHLFKERALWLRGKLCYDLFLERGGNYTKEISKNDLSELLKLYPDDNSLLMLNGTQIDFPDGCDNLKYSSGAPEWSRLQHELICRLTSEINWWINERQAPNGELGGKIGDDVELLRWWSPFLLFGHKPTTVGWKKLADAVWYDPKVYLGYSKAINDVEHAAEFISDSTPELIFIDNDSTYFKRLNYTAKHFRELWSVKHSDGTRFFKSAWYSSTQIDEGKYKNKDVDYNARALKPLRYLAWSSRDQQFIELLMEWSRGWLNAALSTYKDKPKGILPATVDAYTQAVNGEQTNWYESGLYYKYFDWEFSVGSKILDNMLFTYSLTKNDSLLLPVQLTLELVYDKINTDPDFLNKNYEAGSADWAVVKIINNQGFWNAVGKWRLYTNNCKFDSLILKYGTDYVRFYLTNDESYVINNLKRTLDYLRYNTPLRTNLVIHTDRVRTPGADNLKAMLTGDGTPEGSSPYYSISWNDTDTDFTAFVKKSSSENITVELFYHAENSTRIGARLWQLNYGEYTVSMKDIGGNILSEQKIIVDKPGEVLAISIPGQNLVTLNISKNP